MHLYLHVASTITFTEALTKPVFFFTNTYSAWTNLMVQTASKVPYEIEAGPHGAGGELVQESEVHK